MTGASFTSHAYWGAMTCSADDLSNLMDYVLNRLPDRDRDEIVSDLQHVSPVQHWGVWGAGSRSQPGTANGWVNINGIWTVNTVGFAGRTRVTPWRSEPPGRRGRLPGGRQHPDAGRRHLVPGPSDPGTGCQRDPIGATWR
jgi:hypothetical protein